MFLYITGLPDLSYIGAIAGKLNIGGTCKLFFRKILMYRELT